MWVKNRMSCVSHVDPDPCQAAYSYEISESRKVDKNLYDSTIEQKTLIWTLLDVIWGSLSDVYWD